MSNVQSADEYIIYLTTNMVNGKIYVGQKLIQHNNADNTYLGSGNLIIKAVKKYGKENFKRVILQNAFSREEANDIETHYIKQLDATNPAIGYNIHIGGGWEGESNPSKQIRNKQVRCIETGVIYDSTREASRKTGICQTGISSVCLNKRKTSGKMTWEFVDKSLIRSTNLHVESRKAVLCTNNNTIYNSMQEAGRELCLDPSSISKTCRGLIDNTKGYNFQYANEPVIPYISNKVKIKILCENDGIIHKTIAETARYYGITEDVVRGISMGKQSKCPLKFKRI